MQNEKHYLTLKQTLEVLIDKAQRAPLTLQEVLKIFHGKGRYLALILLSLPFCQPLQIPFLSTPLGLLIAFIGLRIAFGKTFWAPKTWLTKPIPSATLIKYSKALLKIVNKMHRWVHPRFPWLYRHSFMYLLHGLLIFLLGIFLALPLPIPLSNLIAAWAIFFIGLGMFEDDGIYVLIGYGIALIALLALCLILFSVKFII